MEVRGWSKSKEGPAGTPNTDSPLARGGQVGHSSNTEQPEKEEDGDKQEEGILPAGGRVTLSQIHTCSPPERIMGIEHGGEKAKGESTNTKREVKAPGVTEWLEPPSALWSRSLALRAGWSFQPGVLGLLAPSPIERDDLLPADASFTHWALLALWPRLQPLMKTGPTIQVATHADHSFASRLQTYITFEGRARPAPLAVWPLGAPVLFLRCCHGRFCFAPTYPSGFF